MPIDPKQFLDLANRLVGTSPGAPEADLRRGISTAYYALFHLLIKATMSNFVSDVAFRTKVGRAFQHGSMRSVCDKYNPRFFVHHIRVDDIGEESPLHPIGQDSQLGLGRLGEITSELLVVIRQLLPNLLRLHEEDRTPPCMNSQSMGLTERSLPKSARYSGTHSRGSVRS